MAQVELIMPKMGESIMEATILSWAKKVGDKVEVDETVLEIATDKVDSEVPSPVEGVIAELLYNVNDVVPVGKPIAIIATNGEAAVPKPSPAIRENTSTNNGNGQHSLEPSVLQEELVGKGPSVIEKSEKIGVGGSSRFYSPLVKNIARTENIGLQELERIPGSGMEGRVTKKDILAYIENRSTSPVQAPVVGQPQAKSKLEDSTPKTSQVFSSGLSGNTEIVEMDRMRRLIADHMVMSKRVSPHVTSYVEVDMTNIVDWREKNKDVFFKKYGEKITYTPIIIEAIAKAIGDFPMINVSVDENKIIVKKDINVGMATALPSGNLIVPVIKKANQLNLVGLAKAVNDLAGRARENKLKPEEIQDGTFTLTNVGTFGNVMGTPIINQPQVAIMAAGAIRKKPAVVETQFGDLIAIRQLMFLSMSYDHRVVDGFLGGSFLRKVGDYLEAFDSNRSI